MINEVWKEDQQDEPQGTSEEQLQKEYEENNFIDSIIDDAIAEENGAPEEKPVEEMTKEEA